MEIVKNKTSFPHPFASFETKKTNAFGVQIGMLISSDWFDGSGFATGNCEFMTRWDYVHQKRLFVRGEHGVKEHKQDFNQRDGALELVNLSFRHINWAEKFCRIVSNGISDNNYKLSIQATDRYSALQKQNKKDYYTKYMVSRNMLQKAVQLQGINLMPTGDMPDNEKEVDYIVGIKDRPKIEIAEEILIDYVFNSNGWEWMEGQYKKDITDVGIVIGRVYLDKNDGVKLSYVDPKNYIHSRVEKSDFSDKNYEGVVETITISDLRRESEFDEETLMKIAKLHNSKLRTDWESCTYDNIVDYKVDILRFAFKTSKNIVYKKKTRGKETIKMSRRDGNWEGSSSTKSTKILDTWMEGNYVLGSECIYGYQECENLYNDQMNKAMSPFITIAHKIYDNRLQSFASNIEEPARMLQKAHLKVQHLLNELKPDGIAIDINQLAELDTSTGGVKRQAWETALNLWETKGIAFVKTINMGEDGIKTGAAITPLAYQQGTALAPLLNVWAHYYNLIRENTGINPARDGSLPSDSLVGVSQLAQLSSNTVTRDIVDAAILFKTKMSEAISTRMHSIFTYSEATHLRKLYENVAGKELLDAVEVLKDRHLHEFGFQFQQYPTTDEINELKEDMTIAIQAGQIDVAVKYETYRLAKINLKMAAEYLKYEIKKTIKEQQEMALERDKNKSQSDAAAAQAAEQAKTQSYSIKKQIDLDYLQKASGIEIMKAKALQDIQQPVAEREFQEEVVLTKLKGMAEWDTKQYMEDRKDDRTAIQATQQSKLKKQAQTDGEPIDFEGSNDWLNVDL